MIWVDLSIISRLTDFRLLVVIIQNKWLLAHHELWLVEVYHIGLVADFPGIVLLLNWCWANTNP